MVAVGDSSSSLPHGLLPPICNFGPLYFMGLLESQRRPGPFNEAHGLYYREAHAQLK